MNVAKNIVPSILNEFLEIAIHNILKVHNMYPDTIFVKKHKYDVLVYQCIYPELQEYIANCIKPVYQMLKEGRSTKIVICFNSAQKMLLNKVVFDILLLKDMLERDPLLLEIERNFRSFFNKLNSTCNYYLNPLPDDATFSLQIHTTESYATNYMDDVKNHQSFPWISKDASVNSQTFEIVPLESVDSEMVKMQIYVEQKL